MLSKTSIVILGMLCEGEFSAYDMLKRIEHMNMKYWWPIGNTTLYETALRLEKKKYIVGNQVGNKLIYKLTESGHEELINTICTIFTRMDYDTIWMSLAVMYSSVLEREKLRELVAIRKKLLEEYVKSIKENQKEHEKIPDIPAEADLSVERMLKITQLEQDLLVDLEEQLL